MLTKLVNFYGVNVSHRFYRNKEFKSLLVCGQPVNRDVVFVNHFFVLLGDLLFKFYLARLKCLIDDRKFFVKMIKERLLLQLELMQLIL
jgi:hypothetical protein